MKKTVIRLTEEQFHIHIKNVVSEALNESDGKTHANQPKRTIVDHNSVIGRVSQTLQRADQSLIAPYKDTTYLFYAMNRMGAYVFLTFKLDDIKKLMNGIGILSGEVVFDGLQLPGDITVDFNRNQVLYKDKASRYQYPLIIDNRTKANWDELLDQLKMSLDNRI